MLSSWWVSKPRKINVIVDNESWILPYALRLCDVINKLGDQSVFVDSYKLVKEADVSFYLGCIHITPIEILSKSKKNLVVHESDLPAGKGFSPLSWQILEGKNEIPITLLEMESKVDSGPIVSRDIIKYKGDELINELREKQGEMTIQLCKRYLENQDVPVGISQIGKDSYYKRRKPEDSKLDINASIQENFNLLRIVDNEKYPAYFDLKGNRYIIKINKLPALNHD